jgi:hypothetical protein
MKSLAEGIVSEASKHVTVANSPVPNPPASLLTIRNSRVAGVVTVAGVYATKLRLEFAATPDAVTTPGFVTSPASILTVTLAGNCSLTLIAESELPGERNPLLINFNLTPTVFRVKFALIL